jgi:hypothetical protein
LARRRTALVALSFAALAWCVPSAAQDPRASEAQGIARDWLAMVDAGDAKGSWKAAGKKFRDAISEDRWSLALGRTRGPLGAFERRTLRSVQFVNEIPGQLPGNYALVVFRTAFANKPDAGETVTLYRDPDEPWRIAGYVVR